jgi:predicted phage baseplate assembly protein
MTGKGFICGNDSRHEKVRQRSLEENPVYGLDHLEVASPDQKTLHVYFIGKAPRHLHKANLVIEGGLVVRDIKVSDSKMIHKGESDEPYLKVVVDQMGDFSNYILKVVDLDEVGRPTDQPMKSFDPCYASLLFSFKAGCPSRLDCRPPDVSKALRFDDPEINYLAKDYASFRQIILDRLALILPDWKERHVPDLGIALVEILAYAGDHLSYYQDAVATEAYLGTARQRISVRRHARLVDYKMHEGCNSRTWVFLETSEDLPKGSEDIYLKDIYFLTHLSEGRFIEGVVLKEDDLQAIPLSSYEVFEPLEDDDFSLHESEINLENLAARLSKEDYGKKDRKRKTHKDGLSYQISQRLSENTRNLLRSFVQIGSSREELQTALALDLNRIMESSLYNSDLFPLDKLRKETIELMNEALRGDELVRFNRMLLEDAFEGISRKGVLRIWEAHNRISIYTWSRVECCLPKGATRATLLDAWLEQTDETTPEASTSVQSKKIQTSSTSTTAARQRRLNLRKGDYLLFEEVKGPRTGEEVDADPSKRVVVRLTKVTPMVDPIFDQPSGQPVLAVEWSEKDALPFSLCISTVGRPTECDLILEITIARGNLVLADHGRRMEESLGSVEEKERVRSCIAERLPEDTTIEAAIFRPRLSKGPLTFRQTLKSGLDAVDILNQDLRQALPCLEVEAKAGEVKSAGTAAANKNVRWKSVFDLLGSSRLDRHFAVEMDNEGRANLRFGDGELGRKPEPGMEFSAIYRVGNGAAGNIGRDMISHLVWRQGLMSGISIKPRNPLPASGGTAAESMEDAKLLAPYAFHKDLQRAITAEDYARLAERHPGVQRAAATIRWTGSWSEVMVAVDPLGSVEADDELLNDIQGYLFKYRRMGQDLVVKKAGYVPLHLEMTVCAKPEYLRGHVEAALVEVFSNRVLQDGSLGFFHPDNLSFGDGIYLSRIIAAAQSVTGVESVTVDKLQRLFEFSNHELDTGVLQLGPLEIARLDNDYNFPENGKLVIDVLGGR